MEQGLLKLKHNARKTNQSCPQNKLLLFAMVGISKLN